MMTEQQRLEGWAVGPHTKTFWQINLHHCETATDVLVETMVRKEIDVALIQEPWVNGKHICGLPKSIGTVFRAQHKTGVKTRTCVVVRPGILATLLPQYTNGDIVTVEIGHGTGAFIASSVYMPYDEGNAFPSVTLSDLIEHCKQKSRNLVLGCDANSHNLLWGSSDTNRRGEILADSILSWNLSILNRGSTPTFVITDRREVIDITLCSPMFQDRILDWKVSEDLTASDHRAITFKIAYGRAPRTRRPVRLPRNTDVDTYVCELGSRIREMGEKRMLMKTSEIEAACSSLNDIVKKSYEAANVPVLIDSKTSIPWWNDDIEKMRKKVRVAFNHAYETDNSDDWESYKELNRKYKSLLRRSKRTSFRNFCSEACKDTEVNRLRKIVSKDTYSEVGLTMKPNGEMASDMNESVKTLIDVHFPGSVAVGGRTRVLERTARHSDRTRAEKIVTREGVRKAVLSFKPFKSAGPDGIFPALLQWGVEHLIGWLTEIFLACMAIGHCPKGWRRARVVFLPKPGKEDYTNPKSYRPISLTSFMLKTMEKVCVDWLWTKVLVDRPIHDSQHAYRAGRSTETALHKLVGIVEHSMEVGEDVVAVFMDIEGAFDRVNHELLVEVLKSRRVHPKAVQWIAAVLSGRIIEVQIGPAKAQAHVKLGCPQGGVLSPLLWNLVADTLMHDIEKVSNNLIGYEGVQCIGYADDVALITRGIDLNTSVDKMQKALRRVERWCGKVKLSVNPTKTESVIFTKKTRELVYQPLTLFGQVVERKREVKYLGVTLNSRLNWTAHIEAKINSGRRIMYQCRNIIGTRWGISPKSLRWIYEMVVRPVVLYAAVVWWPKALQRTAQSSMDRLQRMVCVGMTGAMRTTPTAGLEALLGMPPLHLTVIRKAAESATNMEHAKAWITGRARNGHTRILRDFKESIPELGMISVSGIKETVFEIYHKSMITDGKLEVEDNDDTIIIYTDGSRMGDRTGAGVYSSHLNISQSYSLGPYPTVFQAEMFALIRALDYLIDQNVAGRKLLIATDCQSVMKEMNRYTISSKLSLEARLKLNRVGCSNDLTLFWIKGHSSQHGNDMADELARAGSASDFIGPLPVVGLSKATRKSLLIDWERREHSRIWAELSTCRQTRMIVKTPCFAERKRFLAMSRHSLNRLTALVTGHGPWKHHLMTIGLSEDDICRRCLEEEDTAAHSICRCPALGRTRLDVFGKDVLDEDSMSGIHIRKYVRFSQLAVRYPDED